VARYHGGHGRSDPEPALGTTASMMSWLKTMEDALQMTAQVGMNAASMKLWVNTTKEALANAAHVRLVLASMESRLNATEDQRF
jgi:hypothetical protein